MKKINDEVARALIRCTEALSISELSRRTGIRIDVLSRYITKQTKGVREETWNKILPVVKPYLPPPELTEKSAEPPPRIGKPYRRHHELVEMFSDQKVLLDVFDLLSAEKKSETLKRWGDKTNHPTPCKYTSLSADENMLMAEFLALDATVRENELLALIPDATNEIRRLRSELF